MKCNESVRKLPFDLIVWAKPCLMVRIDKNHVNQTLPCSPVKVPGRLMVSVVKGNVLSPGKERREFQIAGADAIERESILQKYAQLPISSTNL